MEKINFNDVKSQIDMVLWHLQNKGTITSIEAISNYGATRLSAIIFNIKKRGYLIDSSPVKFTNRFGRNATYSKYIYVNDLTQTRLFLKKIK